MKVRREKLFGRAEAILEGRRNGLGEPILRRLALRHYGPAMLSLAARATESGHRRELGRISDAFSPANLIYRAYRLGDLYAAQNMAMSFFNVGDMLNYRRWMHRAALAGDPDAGAQLKVFETRQPHILARRLRRLRPCRRDGT
jgi:hypothetical protein